MATDKRPRTVYLLDSAWEGWEAEASRQQRSISFLMDEYGLKLKDKKAVTNVVREAKLEGFDAFWANYPRKVGKGDAEKAWTKIKAEDRQMVIERLRNSKFPAEIKFIPHPSTWLNGKRYLDDPTDDLPVERQPSRVQWESAPEHIKSIHGKMLRQEELTEVESELIGDFLSSL